MWNQTVKKVDVVGKKIPNFQKWRKTHSNDVYFDSLLEFHCNQCLDASGVDFTYHPDSQIFLNSYEVDDFIPQYIAKKNVKYRRSTFVDLDEFAISAIMENDVDVQKAILDAEDFDMHKEEKLVSPLVKHVFMRIKEGGEEATLEATLAWIKDLYKIDLNVSSLIEVPVALNKALQDEDALLTAYLNLLGKQRGTDLQSEFLSAATDNAKLLILGKIRSSPATASLITTMLLLGYDMEVIIRFLFDPAMAEVLHWVNQKTYDGEFARLSTKSLEEDNVIDIDTPFGQSIGHILDISEEVTKLRTIRSLMENFKTQQYTLDKLMEALPDVDGLYKAIINNDIFAVPKSDNPNFNASMFIFTHPQTRTVFEQVYTMVKYYEPSLNRRQAILRKLGLKNTNDLAYMKIDNYIDSYIITKFLEQHRVETVVDGKKSYKLLTGNSYNDESTPKLLEHKLSTVEGKRAFVLKFKDYFALTKEKIESLGGATEFLSAVNPVDLFKASYSVLGVPIISKKIAEEYEKSSVVAGLKDLKTTTDNKELNRLKLELYQNLSLYALIVSRGSGSKGSMLELFDEINITLAKFLYQQDDVFYDNMVLETSAGKQLMLEKYSTREMLKEKKAKASSNNNGQYDEEAGDREVFEVEYEDYNQHNNEYGDEMDPDMFDEMYGNRPNYEKNIHSEHFEVLVADSATEAGLFTLDAPILSNSLFIASDKKEGIVYQVFPAAVWEALPNTSTPKTLTIDGFSSEVSREMHMLGYQIGLETAYKGGSRILAFEGKKLVGDKDNHADVDHYTVLNNGHLSSVPGPSIILEDEDIVLSGNFISPLTNKAATIKATMDAEYINAYPLITAENTTNHSVSEVAVTQTVSRLFQEKIIHGSELLRQEASLLGVKTPTTTDNILKVPSSLASVSTADETFKVFNGSDVRGYNVTDASTFVPGHIPAVVKGLALFNSSTARVQQAHIVEAINNIPTTAGASLTFYGAFTGYAKGGAAVTTVGGLDVVKSITGALPLNLFKIVEAENRVIVSRIKNIASKVFINSTTQEVKAATIITNEFGNNSFAPTNTLTMPEKIGALLDGTIAKPYTIWNAAAFPLRGKVKTKAALVVPFGDKKSIFTVMSSTKTGKDIVLEVVADVAVSESQEAVYDIATGEHRFNPAVMLRLEESIEKRGDMKNNNC